MVGPTLAANIVPCVLQTTVPCLFPCSWHLLVIPGCPVRSAGDTRVFEVIADLSGGLMTQAAVRTARPLLPSLVSVR